MHDANVARIPEGDNPRRRPAALLLTLFAVGTCFAWWTFVQADHELRAALLQQSRMVAQAVHIESVQALSGTKADLNSPAYLRLKGQFAAIRSSDPRCRFVYLMGRKADGRVFFFMDSEPSRSKDYSPPGQIYEEILAGCRRVFDTKTAVVVDPVTDRWGTWVSALIPITAQPSGAVVAVLGMDIDTHTWKWDVAAKAALPIGLMLMLLIATATVFAATRHADAAPKPVMRRLLPPLAAMVLLMTSGAVALLYQQHRQRLAVEIATDISDVSYNLRVAMDQQAAGLAAIAQPIAANPGMQKALREGDADRLAAVWRPVFETLHREHRITHFKFLTTNRVCLLRVHKPELRGDQDDRFVAMEAERTGKTASGIELGQAGVFNGDVFALRVLQPVVEKGALIGYLELGKEIDDVLQTLHPRSDIQLAVVIRKEHLSRQWWEQGMHLLGRRAEWNRMTRSVVIYAAQGRLPDDFASWADHFAGERSHGETDREIDFDGKFWRMSAAPIKEASGKEVGDLLVMRDVSAAKAAFTRLMVLGGTVGAVVLALLLGFIYVLLRRTDVGIRAQQAELRKSEEKFRSLFESSRDALMTLEPPVWTFTSGNPATLEMFRAKSLEEFISHTPGGTVVGAAA